MRAFFLLIFLIFSISAHAQGAYRFDIECNDLKSQVILELNKANGFEAILPVKWPSNIWRFRVTSPDIPSNLIKATYSQDKLQLGIFYVDPLFGQVNFSVLSEFEWGIYLKNESHEVIKVLLNHLAEAFRIDLYKFAFSFNNDLTPIEEDLFLGLYQMSVKSSDNNIIEFVKIQQSIYADIILLDKGELGIDDLERLKKIVENDDRYLGFIQKLLEISPTSKILLYLID